MRQFPEHDVVDAPEAACCEVGELVEGRPSRQLAVQAVHHVDLANIMIAGKGLGQSANKRLCLFLGYCRDDGHVSVRPPLADDPMPQKDEAVIDVGDMGLFHIQRQLQAVFQKGPAFLADFLSMDLRPFDDDDEVIGIATIGNCRFPLPVLSDRYGASLLNAKVPCPAILARFPVQVLRLQPRIKLVEHDVGQERRQHAALRNTLTGSCKQATVDVARFQDSPEKINKPSVPHPPPHALQKQPVMDGVEEARQITFDDPAAPRRARAILKLHLHGTNCMMHAAFRPEAIGQAMEVAFPDRLHDHQHGALDDAVCQGRYTQRSELAIGFRDIDPLDRLSGDRCPSAGLSAGRPDGDPVRPASVARPFRQCPASGATRRQNDPGGFGKPFPIGNEPQKTIEPPVRIALGPCCELVLHFADYQRSSPRLVR